MFDLGVRTREQHDHLIGRLKAVHPLECLSARPLEARRRFVHGLHRSRAVEDDDAQLRRLGRGGEKWSRERQHRQREQEDLQIQQPILPQFLKRRAGLGVREKFLPEQGAGNELHHTLAFEEIEDNDDGD